MKVNSISGLTCHVKDLGKTAEFYETIGFRRGKEGPERTTFYVNWFFVTFTTDREDDAELRKEAAAPTKGAGVLVHIKVDDIEEFHSAVVSKGMSPANAIREPTRGQREFTLRDPDGYQLVFFEKK